MNTPNPSLVTSNLSEEEQAATRARLQYLQNQAFALMQNARQLKVNLMMAEMGNELTPDLKAFLYGELLGAASIVEAKK